MSERNVELTRRVVEAFNARDIEAIIAYCDPSIEYHSVLAGAVGTIYFGHDGLRAWHRDFEEVWSDDIRLEPEAYFDLGEHTLAFFVFGGRGQRSGVEVAMPTANVARWRDGLLAYFKAYAQRKDALSDLRVSEDQLERIEP